MKKTIATILISVLLTFTLTENYMISHIQVSGATGDYTVSVFGNEFSYEQEVTKWQQHIT